MKKHILSTLIVLLSCVAAYAQPAGWLYETPYAVTNSSPQLVTNYCFPVVVNTQALISAGKMKTNGGDIRFGTPCNGTRMFSYYIDSGINTTSTLIYVTIDSIKPNTTRTIYMFYGNPGAATTSNLNALSGPFTMFNGQVMSTNGFTGTLSGVDTVQAGVYFQPNQTMIVTALGVYAASGESNVLMQLSSYDASTTGTVRASKNLTSASYQGWSFVNLTTPYTLFSNAPSTADGFVVSAALYNPNPTCSLCTFPFYDGYSTGIPTTNVSTDVNILGGVENFFFTLPVAQTAPSIPFFPSGEIEGFTDIKYYTASPTNIYVSILADTSINASAFIDPVNKLVCPGSTTTFSALAGGLAPTYQWQINTGNGWTNLSATGAYTTINQPTLTVAGVTGSMNGYQYRAFMTSTCGTGYSLPATLSVNTTPTVTPVSYISGPNPACIYTNATYTLSTNVQGGSYAWYKNNVAIPGATGSQYSFSPAQGDQIVAVVTTPSDAAIGCYNPTVSVTNAYVINIGSNFIPQDSVAASSDNACAGSQVDYIGYTNVIGGTYQWQVNGQNVAPPYGTASTYTYAPNSGDLITEIISTPNNGCYSLTSATSQPVVATTMPGITPTIQIGGPATAAENQQITLVANILNYGTSGYTIVWLNAGIPFDTTVNTNIIQFTKSPKPQTDYITARIYPVSPSDNTCYSPKTSATFQIGFTPYNEGVNNVGNSSGISAYPNPFSSKVNVTGLKEGDRVMVYDMTGRMVSVEYEATGTTAEYMLGGLASGHYILRVTDAEGKAKANLPLSKL